jgi:hypothetical protein
MSRDVDVCIYGKYERNRKKEEKHKKGKMERKNYIGKEREDYEVPSCKGK